MATEFQHQTYDEFDKVPFTGGRKLGMGAVGIVEEAIGKSNTLYQGQTYARKTIMLDDPQSREAARTTIAMEVDILKQARHDHIVRLIMTYELGIEYAIIMDPRANGNLEQHLANNADAGEKISAWFRCLLGGIAYAHERGIRHRDIKPHNILVHGDKVLLTDFGISLMGLGKTVPTTVIGGPRSRTREYCSPDTDEGHTRGRSADVFSLGAVFLEMLTAYCSPDKLDRFRQTLKVSQPGINRWSYAENMDKVSQHMDTLASTPDRSPWHPTILSLCQKMLQADREQRPKAGDIRAWWLHQPPAVLPPEGCTCSLTSPTEMYIEGGINENLRQAYAYGHRLMVDFWLKKGAKILDNNALVAASEGGLHDILKSLINNGADAKTIGALQKASAGGFKETVEVLLDYGAEVGKKDDNGQTALYAAARGGHTQLAQMLLERGADVEARCNSGQTALHVAASGGHKEVVQTLLERRADVEGKDDSGTTALQLAIRNGHDEVARLLLG